MILRIVAVVIAVGGIADPAFTVSRPVRQPLAITVLETRSLTLPHEGGTRRAHAFQSAARLAERLRDQYDVTIRGQAPGATADPCGVGACVVVSDGARPRVFDPRDRPLGGLRIVTTATPNVAIARLDARPQTDAAALAVVDVHLVARGAAGRTTTIDVLDDGVPVGRATHAWPGGASAESAATVRVEWTPLAIGVRNIHVVARAFSDEASEMDNAAQTIVEVVRGAAGVLVYEPQPSWTGTFVRRALEADARFRVLSRTRLGPSQIAASKPLLLTADALGRENIAVVIVMSPQLLDRGELDALKRFAWSRGGSVVFLLDTAPSGELGDLVSMEAHERREAAPVAIGSLEATEFLVLRPKETTTTVVASAGADPVIVSRPLGHGRVVASGAVDAWRYRADNRFNSFWQSLVASAAEAAGEPMVLTLSPRMAAPGEYVAVETEWRAIDESADSLDVDAALQCGSTTTTVRLWPAGGRGRFRGGFDAPTATGTCELRVAVQPHGVTRAVLRVTDEPTGPFADVDELAAAVTAFGGKVVESGDEASLVAHLGALASPQRVSVPVHVMRSPWWIVPFAVALGLEWWARRRRGLL